MKIKQGFTLAEMIITLSIIGVVAAVTTPMMLNNQPNKEMVMLKKAYYLAGRLINELINDEDFYPENSENPNADGFANATLAPDREEAEYHGVRYGGNSTYAARYKFCGLFAARLNLNGADRCRSAGDNLTFVGRDGQVVRGHFTTTDGIEWIMPIGTFQNEREAIQIDVNGSKGRNCLEGAGCSEPDRFRLFLDKYGRIYLPGSENGVVQIEQQYLSSNDVTKKYRDFVRNR